MAMIKCPECGKEVSDKASACPNCGCPIAPAQQVQTEPQKIRYKMCKQCGTNMPETDNVCQKCGCIQSQYNPFQATTTARENQEAEAKQPKQKKQESALSSVACVLTAISVFAFNFLAIFGLILGLIDLCMNNKEKKHIGSIFAVIVGGLITLLFVSMFR